MFSLFKKETVEDVEQRARTAYEKVVSLQGDGREVRSMRARLALLCRAHLDKTFVAGAETTSAHVDAVAKAISQGKPLPPPPEPSLYQYVLATSGEEVCVYLPEEIVQEAFAIGSLYQRMSIGAEEAITRMQTLADRVLLIELKLDQPLQVLQFLREELAGGSGGS
jgi:hypothetical protein